MCDSVPSARYSPICNVLRQWKTSLIPIIYTLQAVVCFMVCGTNLGSEPQLPYYCQGCIFHGTGEGNQGYVLLMMANKSETALYRAPNFSLLVSRAVVNLFVWDKT